jgi:hypothetical protein
MLPFALLIGSVVLIVKTVYAPWLPILPFAPFLALAILVSSFSRALAWGFASGLCIDVLAEAPFGFYALHACLTIGCSFQLRRPFTHESLLPFSLFTALLSLFGLIVEAALFFLFDRRIPFQGIWWLTEALCLPLFDALSASVWFAIPLLLFKTVRKQWDLYWLKKKNPSPT